MTENIPDYPGYFVSKEGDVFSKRLKWRKLKPIVKKGGYLQVSLTKDRTLKSFTVHYLVALVYFGPRPQGLHICHNDGNPKNNNVSNLRYDTPKNNAKDKEKHGSKLLGEETNKAVLTSEKVLEIIKMRSEGISASKLAEIFNVHKSTIIQIQKRIIWKHLEIPDEILENLEKTLSLTRRGEIRNFSDEEILEIFSIKAKGESNAFLAKKYKTNSDRIKKILTREIYKNVNIQPDLLEAASRVKRVGNEKIISEEKAKKLVEMRKNGASYKEISEKFALSVRQAICVFFQYKNK